MLQATRVRSKATAHNVSAPSDEATSRIGIEFGFAVLNPIHALIKSKSQKGYFSTIIRLSEMINAEVTLSDPDIQKMARHIAINTVRSELRDLGYVVTQWQSGQLLIEW